MRTKVNRGNYPIKTKKIAQIVSHEFWKRRTRLAGGLLHDKLANSGTLSSSEESKNGSKYERADLKEFVFINSSQNKR